MFGLLDDVVTHDGHKGRIVQIIPQSDGTDHFMVEFSDKNLVPPRMEYTKTQLQLDSSDLPWGVYTPPVIKCECGVASVRDGGLHSDYCPLYKK